MTKVRCRLGKEGILHKPVLVLQVWTKWPAIPDSLGGDYRMSGEGWRDATVEDLHVLDTTQILSDVGGVK